MEMVLLLRPASISVWPQNMEKALWHRVLFLLLLIWQLFCAKVLHKYTYLLAMYTESLMQALMIDGKLLTRNEMENEMKRNCGANKKAGWHTVSLVC